MSTPFISVVSPVYKAEKILPLLVQRIKDALVEIGADFEIILVEDGSPDDSWNGIKGETLKDARVKGIKFSRNFGQHYAITAGLENVKGEWVVVMDCDLQDDPREIKRLFDLKDSFDLVLARRVQKEHAFLKRLTSKLFYKTLSFFTSATHDASIANFGIYNRKVTDAFCSMGDNSRNFHTMTKWVGFNVGYLDVRHNKREDGKSTYSWKKLFLLASDTILYFSNRPLYISILLGLIISGTSFLMGFIFLLKYLTGNIKVLGYTSMIISIWFLSGVILLCTGIMGLYIGKIFDKVKNRPFYIISHKIGFDLD